MPSLEELGEPTDAEREKAEGAIDAINESERLGIVPFFDRETEERVLFLVAIREDEDEELSLHPIGPVYDFDETTDRFEMPDELSAGDDED